MGKREASPGVEMHNYLKPKELKKKQKAQHTSRKKSSPSERKSRFSFQVRVGKVVAARLMGKTHSPSEKQFSFFTLCSLSYLIPVSDEAT
ncbi:hypothetical protein TNIN_213961 [Trichonephila inaurata madagascariensis]|uniref:Uncharacterized protein n=1 Tax=Trichonephila inaurata madagascariensis TaxID=2747483 RepID=A0A8X7C417_9ARAC|nr:hypothetical protein TNIN_213961 [Trichonephila inaurata madagascariensis]